MSASPHRHSHAHVHDHAHDRSHPQALPQQPPAGSGFSLIALSAAARLLLVLPLIAALWLLAAWTLRHG